MNIKPGLLWAFLFISVVCLGYGEVSISFESYITAISNKLPEIKINLITLEKASNTYLQSLSPGDTALSANTELTGSRIDTNNGVSSVDSAFSSLFSVGASRRILDTGTTLSAGISYRQSTTKTHMLVEPKTALDFTAVSPALTLSVSQPLLKNAFGMAERYTINDAKLAREVQEYQTELDNRSVLASYSGLFFQWIGQLKTLAFLNESVSNAAMSEKQSRAQLAAGLIDNDDYQSTKNLYLQYQSSRMTYEQAIKSITTQLDYYFETNSGVPDPKEWGTFLTAAIQTEYATVAFENTRQAKILSLTLTRREEAVKVSSNQTLPDLSLYGSLTFAAGGNDGISALTNTVSRPEGTVGLSLSFPLENTDAKNNLKNKELALKAQDWQFIRARQNYEIKLKNLLDEINTKKKILENTTARLAALNSMYSTQRTRHTQGRITQSTLNDTLTKIAAEEINLVDCQYSLIALNFDYQSLIY